MWSWPQLTSKHAEQRCLKSQGSDMSARPQAHHQVALLGDTHSVLSKKWVKPPIRTTPQSTGEGWMANWGKCAWICSIALKSLKSPPAHADWRLNCVQNHADSSRFQFCSRTCPNKGLGYMYTCIHDMSSKTCSTLKHFQHYLIN